VFNIVSHESFNVKDIFLITNVKNVPWWHWGTCWRRVLGLCSSHAPGCSTWGHWRGPHSPGSGRPNRRGLAWIKHTNVILWKQKFLQWSNLTMFAHQGLRKFKTTMKNCTYLLRFKTILKRKRKYFNIFHKHELNN